MKKIWNQPEIITLSISLTKSGSSTYWNETCIQENQQAYDSQGEKIEFISIGGEFGDCGKQPGAPLWYGNGDQGSQVIPPPSAASAGS